MRIFFKLNAFFLSFILMTHISAAQTVLPSPTGQKMIEESNRMYSGNKYNLPQQQYNQLKKQQNYGGIYYNYPYPYYYGNYSYYPPYYDNPYYDPGYGYGYYPPPYYDAFPDDTRADALYHYLQTR